MCGLLAPDPLKRYKDQTKDRVFLARRQVGFAKDFADRFLGTPGKQIIETLDEADKHLQTATNQIEEDPPGVRARGASHSRRRVSGATRRRLKRQPERALRIGYRR